MNSQRLTFAAPLACCLLAAAPTFAAPLFSPDDFYAYTGARAWSQLDFAADDHDIVPDSVTEAIARDPLGSPTPANTVISRARADTGGGLGVFASATGTQDFLPADSFGRDLRARSYAAHFLTFRFESDTLPAGTPVTAKLSVSVHGDITWRDGSNGRVLSDGGIGLYADMYLGIQGGIDDEDWDYFYEGDVDYNYTYIYDPNNPTAPATIGPPSVGLYGDFVGHATESAPAPDGTRVVSLNHSTTIDIPVLIGSTLYLQSDMYGEAWASNPYDVHATAAFYDSATVSLAPADASFRIIAVVPEPAALAAGLLLLSTLHRRPRKPL